MSFPNYDSCDKSPDLEKVGVAVVLGAKSFRKNEPVALYGSYLIDAPLMQKMRDDALHWVKLIAIRRDAPGVYWRGARENTKLQMPPPANPPKIDPSSKSGGWFNLDLRDHLKLPAEPGKYFLFAAMADHMTERMEFELQ